MNTGGKLLKSGDKLHPVQIPSKAWLQVGIDLIRSMNKVIEGKRYIFTAVDYMMNYVEAEPISQKTGEVTKVLFKLLCQYGASEVHITDQGSELNNSISDAFCQLMDTKHKVTSAYHPQSSGFVENANKTIEQIIPKNMYDNEDN